MTTITCQASILAKALRDVTSIVTNDKMLILNNVLIEATNGKLKLTATTMDIMISRTIEAEVAKPGAFTVPAVRFRDIAAAMPDGAQVKIVLGDGTAVITGGRSRFRLGTLPATDFPQMAFAKPSVYFDAGADFITALASTRYAHSVEATRYYLCGVFMHVLDGQLAMAATEGQCLAQIVLGAAEESMAPVILPTLAVAKIIELSDDKAFSVEIAEDRARFVFGDVALTSKLIDGTFPAYQRVIPNAPPLVARFNREDLAGALSRVAIVAEDKERKIVVSVEPGKIVVTAGSRDDATEEIPCEYVGDPVRIGFNCKFLADTIKAIGRDNIEMHFTDAAQQAVLKSPDRTEMLTVLMPMRI